MGDARLTLANQLLRGAADECVWGDQVVPHQSLTPDQMRDYIFYPRKGGVTCGGMAHFYRQILQENGFDAEEVGYTTRWKGYSHVTVFVHHEGKRYVFDPLYSGRYVDVAGDDMDFDRVLAGELACFVTNPMHRTVVSRADIARRRRFRWRQYGLQATWEDEPNEHGFVACHGFAYTPAFFRESQADDFARLGIAPPDDIILWHHQNDTSGGARLARRGGSTTAREEPDYIPSSVVLDTRDRLGVVHHILPYPLMIFDVGANAGNLTEQFRQRFPAARVIAFEPNPELEQRLLRRFDGDSLVTLERSAVGKANGTLRFHINAISATSSRLPRNQSGRRYYSSIDRLVETVTVPEVTLDSYCAANGIETIDLLKLDIQGGEAAALEGAMGLLRAGAISVVFTEIFFAPHYEGAALFHEIWAQLASAGYSLFDVFQDRYGRNGQLRFGDAIFVSPKIRSALDEVSPEP